MIFLKIILCILAGSLLSGIWFGSNLLINSMLKKYNLSPMIHFSTVLSSIIPIIIIGYFMGLPPLQADGLTNLSVYIIGICTVIFTILIITSSTVRARKVGKELLLFGLDGALMEVPQRLMMQSFLLGLLHLLNVTNENYFSIIITGFVWCISICIQCFICKTKFNKDTLWELLASFVFSLGIGYVYQQTGFILITMLAHFLERIFSSIIFNKRQQK